MNIVTPINNTLQQSIIAEVERYIQLAECSYHKKIAMLDVHFDLKGKAAGMYSVKLSKYNGVVNRRIRFNPWLFAKYFDDSWQNTIAHEVAHYVTDCLFGLSTIRPHGKEWQQVMVGFGVTPKIYANYNLDGIPLRRMVRYQYRCQCRKIMLSSQRHKKIVSGLQRYRCRDCGSELMLVTPLPLSD